MQEEVTEKTIALCIKGGKITAQILKAPVILWDSSRVWKILTAYVYTGAMVLGKSQRLISGKKIIRIVPKGQQYITEGTHEAIVSREEFEKAQLVIRNNGHRVVMGSVDFPLKGKIRCGNCRRAMGYDYKQASPIFWCREGMELIGQTQCSSEIYQASDIENAVFQALKKELSLLDSLYSDIKKEEQSLKEASRKASRRKTLMEQELKNLKGEKMRMYEEYAAGTLSLDNYKRELEYEKFDGYELPPRTQFSMLNKPAVSIKYGVMKFNMACIRLFEGIKYVLPILHPNKKRLALIMCPEEDSASVEWARQKDENWVNKDITSLEFVENIFKLMNWNRECRYKVLGRVANSDQGLCMLFDLEEAIMFTPKPQEYTDPLTGEMKKKQIKFFPDVYKDRIGKSYNDYIAGHQMNLFEDFIGYQGSAVLDEPEQKTDTISVPIPQCEESENIPLSDFPEQPENVQRPGSEVVEKGMLT